jgi:hypothetical protein
MSRFPPSRESKTLPWFVVACLLCAAALFIATGLRDESLGAVLAGVGFAVYGISTYRDPVVFRTPLLVTLRVAPVKSPFEQGLDLIALSLVASGLLLRWTTS